MKNKEITMLELFKLISDNNPPKKIRYKNKVYIFTKRDYSCKGAFLSTELSNLLRINYLEEILNIKFEILPEENDEWEDIEKINVIKDENCKRFIEYDSETGHHKYTIRLLDEYFSNKINELIKNQKYLKERLDKNEIIQK